MRLTAALLALAVIAAPLAAQSNAERIANDQYTRSHDYDLVHQRIELNHFNWDSTSFDGRVTSTVRSLRSGLDSLILDAGALLDVKSIRAVGANGARGAALTYHRHGDTLVVRLARPAAFHDTVRFVVDYHARIDNGKGLTWIQPEGRPHRPQQIWSQGEDHNNHYWFPTYDFPNDKMTWEVVATVPRQFTAVSNGLLRSDKRNPDGTRTMDWHQDEPSATYLVSLIVAPLAKIHDTWKGKPVDYYVYHSDSTLAWRLFHVTPDMIDTYSKLTGVAYPWAKYGQTTVADFFGGMENVSATTLVDWLPDANAYQDRPWYQWILIPHELAHQWFGDYVTTENWANMWLNEGFAEFMPGQYWGTKLGPHVAQDYYLDEYRQFMQIDARRRMPLASNGSNNIYPKGALVLEMLRKYLGPQRFWASVNRYLTVHKFDNAVTDDFRQAVLDATGQNLDWFWDEWFYQAGYPEFTVSASYDSTAHRLALHVQQTQRDTATADSTGLRYTTPAVFHMPLTVRVGTAHGDVVAHDSLHSADQTFFIDSLPGAPTMVVFDDDDAILKTLKFDQPTAWLAEMLRREDDLWNRQWAIEELETRPQDAAAAAALADAAQHSDYYLTRSAAAEALAAFPASEALPAIEAALKDTSAAVRASAAGTLGRLGGDDAARLARTTWEHDSSYNVRAAALLSLARLDPAQRAELVRTGLKTPSYRDAIQNAALSAIAQSRDTTLVPLVEGVIGDQELPSYLLAAMAGRGSSQALDLLSAHLDDDREYVRQWVLQAFQQGMPDKVALPRLQQLQGSIKHADTRAAVQQAIEQMQNGQSGQ
ncbi:MAG TPA: M1 family aminopeptidase [Gemmatimonadales bacterium]|nr:M1 family aminopeptidase [Gemmatimonadales bacterium]